MSDCYDKKPNNRLRAGAWFRFAIVPQVCLIVFLLDPMSPGMAQNWPQWRGAGRDGRLQAVQAPSHLPDSLQLEWRIPIGAGYSSPILSGGRIYLHTRQGEEEVVSSRALETGRTLWSAQYPAPFKQNPYATRHGKGPNATPVLHAGRLYTYGMSEILSCFDAASGERLWRNDYSKTLDTSRLFCGAGMSPLIVDDRLIVHVGDDRGGALVALDLISGREIWRTEGDGPGYASPILASFDGVDQVITLSDGACLAVSPDSGQLLWRLPFADEWNENIVTPVPFADLLIVSGVRQGTMALRITREGGWNVDRVWLNKELPMYMSSPVLSGDRLFGFSSARKGHYFCLDPRTGETVWQSPGRQGMNASILVADRHVFGLNSDGQLVIADKSAGGYRQLGQYQVAESTTFPHPILVNNLILIKDLASLSLWSFGD